MTRTGTLAGVALLVAIAVALPFCMQSYDLRIMNLGLITAVAVLGLCVTFGWGGLVQLGAAAFVATGAYVSALLTTSAGLSFWIAMPVAVVCTALFAWVISAPILRLRGHYLAIATIGLNVVVVLVARNWEGVTGGYDGVSGIPAIAFFGHELRSGEAYYTFLLATVTVCALGIASLRQSRFGRAMLAVRDDEISSAASGIAVVRTKTLAFMIGAALGGLSGALYAHYARFIGPQEFEFARSITLLVMLIVGGEASVIGAILGAVLLTFAPEWLRFLGDA